MEAIITNYREILRLDNQGFSQRSIAAGCDCSRNTVAKVLQKAAEKNIRWPLPDNAGNGDIHELLFPSENSCGKRQQPDFDYIRKELARQGVTLKLLWQEYCDNCRQSKNIPLMYSQFCHHYQQYAARSKATMHITRKPGENLEVDWAGQKTFYTDRNTGEPIKVSVFVAALSYSQYAYAEAFHTQGLEDWIAAHVNMYSYLGGSTRILTPDNLKTGVEKAAWQNPVINRSYQELAEHYNTAVIPARVRKPKDKPVVENAVGIASTWILAALRNQKHFSLYELNEAIKVKLQDFNATPFQKKEGCRKSAFTAEKPTLIPLPPEPYELAVWKTAIVQYNYHVSVDKMFYSIPYEYIKHEVDLRLTRNMVEVFFSNQRICSHRRLRGLPGQYSTNLEHMPEKHRQALQWDAERFTSWARQIGENTEAVVKAILSARKVEQQGYRSCMALLKLSDKYSAQRLEAACGRALTYTPRPAFQNVKDILVAGLDKLQKQPPATKENDSEKYGFTRGADYYGRKS